MIYETSYVAVGVFAFFVALVLGISFYLGAKAKSAQGYYAAHGEIPWLVNGVAFAGDYLSAASFLGICGMIAFYGYDGFLYSIGYLAGWIVALLVISEPLKRLGKFTFADALDSQFNSRGIKLAAAISTLVVSIFYLIPQMVGAGALVKPLLGLPHEVGVFTVGVVVILIVTTAGMVSTTWVQFIKGALLVLFCTILTGMILQRGLTTEPSFGGQTFRHYRTVPVAEIADNPQWEVLAEVESAAKRQFLIVQDRAQLLSIWRRSDDGKSLIETQFTQKIEGRVHVNGLPWGRDEGETDFFPVGNISRLPGDVEKTGPLGPLQFFSTLQQSEVVLWPKDTIKDHRGIVTTVWSPQRTAGADVLVPGASPTFKGVRGSKLTDKLDFLSLMLALFAGTASLPHILIRYYTVKDQASARKSTMVGIASIGFFYILTLYLGLGAMTSGMLDVTDSNMAAPLLARSFGNLPFAVISAIAFTTVLGTVSGLILAASGAVAHDLLENFFRFQMTDHEKVRAGKLVAVVVGIVAIVLGILFKEFNVTFLVGWAFNVAASANLPALIMLLWWKGTTKQGITAAIFVGMISSLGWILLSQQAFRDVYMLPPDVKSFIPFSQPAIVTLPLGFLTLVVVSLMTQKKEAA